MKKTWNYTSKWNCTAFFKKFLRGKNINQILTFKEGIKPMWEDDKNKRGGRWLINLDKKQRQNSLDNFWLEVMLCLIGESFDDHSQYVSRYFKSPTFYCIFFLV